MARFRGSKEASRGRVDRAREKVIYGEVREVSGDTSYKHRMMS